MIIEDLSRDINEFENLLQKIATDITSGVIFERLPPEEIWNRSESSVTRLQNLAERIREAMLLLKPEKTSTIERSIRAVLRPLNAFKESLFREAGDPVSNARLALEQLRKSVMEGTDLVELARDVEKNPSKMIAEVLKLREVYGAKEYLSAIPVPELVHTRFMGLKRRIQNLRSYISNLEKALEEVRAQLDMVEDEIKKFHPSKTEVKVEERKEEEPSSEPPSEPQLVRRGGDL